MPVDLSVLQGNYFCDLMSQPKALEDTLDQFAESKELRSLSARLDRGKFNNIVLTGMGSSYYGLNPLLLQLTDVGFPALLVETSELNYYRPGLLASRNLIIAVSQSGQSAEILRLLDLLRGRAPLIAVTNTSASPLARRSDALILTKAGEEYSVSCKTYVSALLALKFLGDQLCRLPFARTRKALKTALPPVTQYLAGWKEHVESLLPVLEGIRLIFLVGRGSSLAAVGTGALILKESTQFPAEGLSSAAFRHGPFEMVGPETFILVFSGPSKTRHLNHRLLDDIRKQNGRTELVEMGNCTSPFVVPNLPPSLLPILEILPVEMLTLAQAARAGHEPGRFRFATKITTTE